ncbi:MAG: endonuclease [Cryptosporangiaceae bacterium]|nr:endonuclease [Cryptosporangiaceae bacterium]
MPEGHTIHRLAREHKRLFGGRTVAADSPQGRFAEGAALITGSRLTATDAHGKHLFHRYSRGPRATLGDPWLHVHLGLYGEFRTGRPPAPAPVGAIRLRLTGERAWTELRGPTACEIVTAADKAAIQARLGPDPLRADADPERAWKRISASRTEIGRLLMDQEVLAGVGNVYRAEVLFRHGVDPHRHGRDLWHETWLAMWPDLVALMTEGVRTGRIDTVHDLHTPEAMNRPPRVDDHGGEVYVYRRSAMPCLICETPVSTEVVAGRNLFWCAHCQI